MSTTAAKLLLHPNALSGVLSVRAKAMIFADPVSQALLDQIGQVAPSDAAVLIVGETGTGKELVARDVHAQSRRRGDFVAVNCGALSQTLAEAELFGHQAGSFTGATETRAGWFEAADGGTLFLDEVGDLPLPLQVKLLRVLQEREVVRVGARKAVRLDVRVVAATNIDLTQAVAAGRFRRDLYYRLNVVTLTVPPLSKRRGDILPLAEHFLEMYSGRLNVLPPRLEAAARHALLDYSWPGNIRELENVMHSALLVTRDGVIRPENLRFAGATAARPVPASLPVAAATGTGAFDIIAKQLDILFAAPPPQLYDKLDELIVSRGYAYCSGNQVHTARLFGLSRHILRTLLKRCGLIVAETA
ncbi:MAG TPA: sigma-54 dependent transcriptional regulator [Steroidobacteraceae bacterium]|jgi:DNA-binding NtrC family response regulator|nr:sigma-54 dependent transcriptional regulator [Steroidobacteraceae bacterium]